ncbi:MAG: hypothetical protein CMF71_06325 [Magnetovibrio sp.]|nr:hypothetical protein [Magnetovibrio sp.]MBH89821.1 hypothetical protein [Magnetovibrio sp.]|tara:strand:+ start:1468 stop:1848 length:381 start_codon:yes stop_codon:yes gene_type:complete
MRFFIYVKVLILISACSTSPYVHRADQYNRSSDDFGRTITDISQVVICYNTFNSTPDEIVKLALDECKRYGKSASFLKQDYGICPITAHMSASYTCMGDKKTDEGYYNQGIPKGAIMNYDGIKFRY